MVAAALVPEAALVTRDLPLSLLGGVLLLMAVLAVAAVVIVWVGRWLKRPAADGGDDLAYYRLLYERGEFSREEYERIRAQLGQRLRKEWDLPENKPAAPPPPSAPDERMQTRPIPPVRPDADAPPAQDAPSDPPAPDRPTA